tara:strand:- start:1994 stop:2389 length:396 start_codon:yes stop_codon:yes gene_type:complete
MSAYLVFKYIHITFALLSISSFILRGFWMMQNSAILQRKPVKILPHIIDTVFLLSAISLLFILGFGYLQQGWLLHKISLMFVYILLGVIALGQKYSKSKRVMAFFAGVLVFFYIIGIAIFKTALSWLVLIF